MILDNFYVTKEGIIEGDGKDDAGEFTFEGKVNAEENTFRAEKKYPTWIIYYQGDINKERTRMWGFWGFKKGSSEFTFEINAKESTTTAGADEEDDEDYVPLKVWKGYYEQFGNKNEMNLDNFYVTKDGIIEGDGKDAAGEFTFEGKVNAEENTFRADKKYPSWIIYYSGDINKERTRMWGFWGFKKGASEFTFEINAVNDSNAKAVKVEKEDSEEGDESDEEYEPIKVWEGYYEQFGNKNEMNLDNFYVTKDGIIEGDGKDAAGEFTFEGKVNDEENTFRAEKKYPSWIIYYQGDINKERTRMWGFWGFKKGASEFTFEINAKK